MTGRGSPGRLFICVSQILRDGISNLSTQILPFNKPRNSRMNENHQLYLKSLARRSGETFLVLLKIMLPVMILVRIGEEFGVPDMLGGLLGPVMGLAGLPAEAGLVWAICMLTGLYGGVGAYLTMMPGLDMSLGQHSVLCAMMLTAHALPVEQAIVRKAGASFIVTSLLRIAVAFAYGVGAAWLLRVTGSLSEPLQPVWIAAEFASPGWAAWVAATTKSLATIFFILTGLLVLLDIMNSTGLADRIARLLEPVLKGVGMDARLAPVTTIGLLMGLAYGGALIIQAFKDQDFDPRARFMALSCLSLLHGLIEDTTLMLAIGADPTVILVGRIGFSLAVIAILSRIVARLPVPAAQ